MVLWTTPTPTLRASCWGCGIARARTVRGSKSRRSRRSRTSRSSVRCRTSPSTRFPGSGASVPMHAPIVADTARPLAAARRHAEVVEYLGAQPASEVADSPSLALLYGTAQARLGRHDEGQRWLDLALDLARKRDEQAVERDALNARGASALVSGRIDEAADYFTQALLAASRDGDAVTTGRCSNNLGIISSLRDRVGEAEDRRVAASLLVAGGQPAAAEVALREVIARAEPHGRPQLLAEATRDLALLLRRSGRTSDAQTAARRAKAVFTRLGAEGEIRNLANQDWDDDFAAELRGSLAPLNAAQALADAGLYAELLSYLSKRSPDELEQSPVLTLLCGIAHARLGRLDLGQQWAMVAQLRARMLGDRALEVRALNVSGAIALERGGISEATYFFTRAQEKAMQDDDMATVGRCANNLGIIANMQGDYNRAGGAYTRAITAYEKASYNRGVVESQHNLGITYREQGQLDHALRAADAALREAERLGDRALQAQALAGLAEIRVARGEPESAIRDAKRALAVHRELKDAVLETEDLRILAVALGVAGKAPEAEAMLRQVIDRATEHQRPQLVASAQRDLAHLLALLGDVAAAKQIALSARATFERLRAKVETEKLDALLAIPDLLATKNPGVSQATPDIPIAPRSQERKVRS